MSIKQKNFELLVRDCLRIKAELICNLYEDERIVAMSSAFSIPELQQYDNQEKATLIQSAIALLRDGQTKDYLIEVESGSTHSLNQNKEKEQATEFLTAIGSFLSEAMPLVERMPVMTPLVTEVMNFVVRQFHSGRSLEYKFNEITKNLNEQAQQEVQGVQQLSEQFQQFQQSIQQTMQQGAAQVQANTDEIGKISQTLQRLLPPPTPMG